MSFAERIRFHVEVIDDFALHKNRDRTDKTHAACEYAGWPAKPNAQTHRSWLQQTSAHRVVRVLISVSPAGLRCLVNVKLNEAREFHLPGGGLKCESCGSPLPGVYRTRPSLDLCCANAYVRNAASSIHRRRGWPVLSDVFAACENKQTNRILAAQSLVAHLKTNPCFTRRVAHICKPSLERADDFADLRRGDSQGIESYMDKVDASAREMLFQNLLMIDVDSRRQRGETPAAEEYLSRFPSFSSIVRQTFMEDQSASLDAAAASPADMPTIVHGLADSRQLGEYELLLELGRGGFGVVYKARPQQRNDLVALKILPSHVDGQSLSSSSADRLHKFRREFRSLANINHPNLIGMQTLECEGNQWFFTMDLIDGVSFRDYVRPGGELNEERLRHAAKQLVEGVLAMHDRGIVHRDLKPSNVLVDAGGHVTILDFGLIAELQQRTDQTASMRSAQFGGTPVYAAPEQAMGERTAASDWYALGVMLYEALTGETPFRGANNVALVVKKQNEDAPLLSGSLEVPMDLAALVDQLLRRDPQQRPNASTISSTLGVGGISSLSDAPDDDSGSLVQGPEYELIGRQSHLQQLADSLSDLIETNSPVITFVSGRSGEGKTSLVEKFLDPLRLGHEVLVLSGRCYDRESVPFKAVDNMIDAIVAFLRSRPDDDVVKYLPDDIRMLAHLFPILRRVSSIADRTAEPVQGLDDRQIRYRAFFALRDMLISISSSTPVVMFIDDLQWGMATVPQYCSKYCRPRHRRPCCFWARIAAMKPGTVRF